MRILLTGLGGALLFLAGAFAVYAANGRPRYRYRQLLLPLVALVYGIVVILRFDQMHKLVRSAMETIVAYVPVLGSVNVVFFEMALFNFFMLLGFVVVKGAYKVLVSLFAKPYELLMGGLIGHFFEYDEDYQYWFLRDGFYGVRRLLCTLYWCVVASTAVVFLISYLMPGLPIFQNPFYPAFPVLVFGESCFCLLGMLREEYLSDVVFEDDGASRVFQYAKLQEVLRHYFGDRLLQLGSRGASRKSAGTHDDFCTELLTSENYETRLAGGYFRSLVSRGVLSADERTAQFGPLNHDLALECVRMLHGDSVIFATPFYRDFVPYVFLPLSAQLMRNRRALVLYGSGASAEGLATYMEEGLAFATGISDMWRVGTSMDLDVESAYDVALVPFSSLGNVRNVIEHADFLAQVGFVIVIDPSSLLATYQIGLNYLAEYLSAGTPATYCVFDHNSDGLVDSLSHALRVNLTEVSATEYAEGAAVYMMWDVDGNNLQHRLMPGVAQYLGVGTEIGLVALKSQVSKVAWASGSFVPLADQRWIDGQYYGDLLSFAQLPQEQLQLDRHFEWYSDLWSIPKAKNRFIVVEDEYSNMFEAFRQFITRGSEQAFVNVLSPHYLLRDYMVDNSSMFEADPKAVPALSPDFSKSQRNAIFSIVMAMAQSEELVDENEIASRLRYVGLPFHNVQEALEGLLIDHIHIPDDYRGILPERQLVVRETEEYDPLHRKFVEKRYFGLSNQAMYSECFSSLRSVPLVTEAPDGSEQLLGARLYGHVHQSYLPGQFTVIDGKYYEVVSVSDSSGVVLRRAADYFTRRRYYRQLRSYIIENWCPAEEASSTRTLSGITVQRIVATMTVSTQGYLDMASFGDLGSARLVQISDVPDRRYTNKTALRLQFPDASAKTIATLAVLMSEFMVTLFPKDWEYVAVLAPCAEELPQGVLYRAQIDCPPDAIYIVEDSLVDIGLVSSIDRNVGRILELCWDYLDWHHDRMLGVSEPEVNWEVGELPAFVPPMVRKGFFRRLLDKITGVFRRKQKSELGAGFASAPMPMAGLAPTFGAMAGSDSAPKPATGPAPAPKVGSTSVFEDAAEEGGSVG